MNSKLTVMLNGSIINKAKRYAKANKTSLSKMIESYFQLVVGKRKENRNELPAITKELSGMIKSRKKVGKYKKILDDALKEKYL